MKTKRNSNVFITLIKIGLICYTMLRTVDLVMSTLPESIKIFGVAAIFGLDIALLAWDNYAADPYKARSDGQHKVGVIMIVVNLIGIGAALVADSMRVIDPAGNAAAISTVSVWVISIVILSNVAALIGVNQLDPDRAEQQAEAEHERKLAKLKAEHERDLQENDLRTELDVSKYRNSQKIKTARRSFFLSDDDHNGTPDIVDAAKRGDLDALRKQLETALETLQHTAAKSPNGHNMAVDGAAKPRLMNPATETDLPEDQQPYPKGS
jgi:hypothetical protein